jgi:hypothetical protein
MTSRIHTTTAALFLILGVASLSRSEVLDRIVAVVNGRFIITQSDIRKERLILEVLGKRPGADAAIRAELIDRHLVEEQIEQFPGVEVTERDVAGRLAQIKNNAGIPPEALREAVVAEIRLSEFIIQRFRQFIRVSDEELEAYYREVFLPAQKAANGNAPPLDAVSNELRREIVGAKLDTEVTAWLQDLRRRSDVEIF